MPKTTRKVANQKHDTLILCKNGEKCNQKTRAHLAKYKHPSKNTNRKQNAKVTPSKSVKLDKTEDKTEHNQIRTLRNNQDEEATRVAIEQNGNRKKITIRTQNKRISKAKVKKTLPDHLHNEESGCSKDIKKELIEKSTATEPSDPKAFIKTKFLVDLPADFYTFWDFCKQLKPAAPSEALKDIGLELVGPYDVLAGKFKNTKKSPEEYLRHWRYYYDPPEVLTVIKGDESTGYHIGYFYDVPEQPPSFLVSNHGVRNGIFGKIGDNIFCAVSLYLEELTKTASKKPVDKFLPLIKAEAGKLQVNMTQYSQKMYDREINVLTETFNKIGLVVPKDRMTQLGYRGLAMKDNDLINLLTELEKSSPEQKTYYLSRLQYVLTNVSIALDECDFAVGVKLGWELLYHGIDSLNSTISRSLSNSYRLLKMEAFAKIAEAHMNKRGKGCDLSII